MTATTCNAETPNPFGNRKGYCTCTLEKGHDGRHLCQSAGHHEWDDENGSEGQG